MTNPTSALLVKPIHLVPSAARLTTPLAQHLRKSLRGDVLFDAASRGRYATDASIYQITPIGVVVPRDQDDLRIALDIARSEKVPLLARGAGTSQCGQTVGEALVIDTSKWLNNIVAFDAEARTVTVEPGVVLDHLNAWLKPHGLWFPVDVSTAAQCTIGGMAGNNSCGSRSIEYGNMVHNVDAIDAILADGSEARFASLREAPQGARLQQIVEGVKQIAQRERDEIVARVPKVLRRVAGYNIDVFDCQNPRAYTDDGIANLAHLLVGSEGTLAFSRQLTLKLAPLPTHKTLGVVNFPTFWQSMDLTQHIVKLKPVAVELVDRTMIDLAMSNPAFRPVIEKALVGEPQAILLVEFAGEDRGQQLASLKQLTELMADLGLPDSVVEMPDANEQKALWEVRKAGLNIMMSMKGDGKPVSFIEDCAVPLEHLAEYTSRLTEVFHRQRHGRHLVCACECRHAARAADSRYAARRRGEDARDRRRSGGTGARIQGRVFRRTRRRLVPRRMGRVAIRAASESGVHRDQGAVRSGQPLQSRQDRASAEDGRRAQFPLCAGLPGASD